MAGRRLGVRTTSPDFARWLDGALGAYLTRQRPELQYSVVSDEQAPAGGRRSFHLLYRGSEAIARTLDVETLATAFLDDIESYTFRERPDLVYLSATLVGVRGRTVLVPAWVGAGLRSAPGRPRAHGATVRPGRFVAVDAAGEVVPVPRSLAVAADAVARLRAGGNGRPAGRAGASTVHPALADRVRVDAVCWVGGAGDGGIRPAASRAALLHSLGSAVLNLPAVGGGGLAALRRLVDGAVCLQWTAPSSPATMLDRLVEALPGTAAPGGRVPEDGAFGESGRMNGPPAPAAQRGAGRPSWPEAGDERGAPQGEHVALAERLIVSPGWGRLRRGALGAGQRVLPGAVVGRLDQSTRSFPVASPVGGWFAAWLAREGEWVPPGRPLLVLRSEAPPS